MHPCKFITPLEDAVKEFTGVLWEDEIREVGFPQVLVTRLKFHGSLSIEQAANGTGRSPQTVRKHMRRMVEDGTATWRRHGDNPQGMIVTKQKS